MIVDATPRLSRLVAEVWKPLAVLFVWDVVVTVAYYVLPFKAPSLPLTLFGTALALFLGFHLATCTTMTVGLFGYVGLAAWLALLPAGA